MGKAGQKIVKGCIQPDVGPKDAVFRLLNGFLFFGQQTNSWAESKCEVDERSVYVNSNNFADFWTIWTVTNDTTSPCCHRSSHLSIGSIIARDLRIPE
jgi:hypothetical protein